MSQIFTKLSENIYHSLSVEFNTVIYHGLSVEFNTV